MEIDLVWESLFPLKYFLPIFFVSVMASWTKSVSEWDKGALSSC